MTLGDLFSADGKPVRSRKRILTDSARKRNGKEVLANYNKTRINIGHQHDRWVELKDATELMVLVDYFKNLQLEGILHYIIIQYWEVLYHGVLDTTRFSRDYVFFRDFLDNELLLTRKLLNQGSLVVKMMSSLRNTYLRSL
jgi:hypothetical protein